MHLSLIHIFDLRRAFAAQLLLLRLAPKPPGLEEAPHSADRLEALRGRNLLGATIARGIIRGRVIAQAVGQRLDYARAAALARSLERLANHFAHDQHIVAIHLLSGDARGDRLLCQRLRGGLRLYRYRDRPAIVDDHAYQRQRLGAGQIQRLVERAL